MRFSVSDVPASAFWSRVERGDGCWRWTAFRDSKGYGRMMLPDSRGAGRVSEGAYRIAWALENGPIPGGMHVLHKCNNPGCVRPDHLRIGTHAENMQDRAGLPVRWTTYGADCAAAKLSAEDVSAIRALRQSEPRLSQRAIAARFGISQQNVSQILRGATWRTDKP